MDTKLENYPPMNDDSDGANHDEEDCPEEEVDTKPPISNVADILKRLQSSGALIKKPKKEHRCVACDEDFRDWEELEQHLIQHVSLPSVVLYKLPSDEEDNIPSEDDNWSDEEDDESQTKLPPMPKTPQKVDISQIKQSLNKTGITIKKPNLSSPNNADAALNKLSGLGFTIKKNSTPIKQEQPDPPNSSDLMKKLGQLGGIKLKLKSDGSNTNSFKVVNGLKDFNTSDDEGEGSANDEPNEDDADGDQSKGDQDSDEEQQTSRKNSDSEDQDESPPVKANLKKPNNVPIKIIPKMEPAVQIPQKVVKGPGRPAVKQTPKRADIPVSRPQQSTPPADIKDTSNQSSVSTPERRGSRDSSISNASTVALNIKQEVDKSIENTTSSQMPLFSGQIKSERSSPPIEEISTPIIATVKSEPIAAPVSIQSQPTNNYSSITTTPLLPVTKKENTEPTIIEINIDSNDEDDDCCVVSSTPAPDIKPIIPKTEIISTSSCALPNYSSSQSYSNTNSHLASRLSMPSYTEKQHAFDWNAPDSKPPMDIIDKSADDIFESLLSSAKKENSLSDASEYISLDTLGPKHLCEVCNTRFTDISLLEDHKRMTGHSQNLVLAAPSSSLVPYSSSNILSSLLPVKQLAEQVGKLVPSGMANSGSAFTHQQNVMINIQAYPGAGMPQSYNSYAPGQNMHQGYQQPQNNLYGQQMPNQYSGQGYGPQGFGQQYSQPMSKSGFSPSYSAPSPLQSMQQSVYGQAPSGMNQMGPQGQMNVPLGAMGAPGQMNMGGPMGPPSSQSNMYIPASSPGGSMKPQLNNPIKIQNIQSFPPGQMPNVPSQTLEMPPPPQPGTQSLGGPIPSPGTIRMAPGAMSRPRMSGPRGPRPTIRPGIQVQSQARGGSKPNLRMPLKRPAGMAGGPVQKRRDMLLPGKHDNEDCQVMAMQKQRQGMPMISSVQGAKDKLNLGSQISITKKTVNREANAMADVLASRGISVKQKQKSRSPTPERPIPHIPNLGSGMSIKHTSKSSNFSIPEARVGGSMLSCRVCKKMFSNNTSLQVHMSNAHPHSKIPMFKCDECPASYPKSLQLQHHKRTFHNMTGPNRELGIPIVDMANEDNLKKLCNIGIYSFIPLAQANNGTFGIPVISVHNMQNGNTKALQGLGADGLLSLGPLKPLPNTAQIAKKPKSRKPILGRELIF